MTRAETAWAEAMKYANRHDPYPFFDQLRKTPVVRVAEKTYVVTGYRELLALAHDPRISSDLSRSPIGGQGAEAEAQPGTADLADYGHDTSIIVSDPPDHDRARRQLMRHFGPPHAPDVIPKMEPISKGSAPSCSTTSKQRPRTGSTSSMTTHTRCPWPSSARFWVFRSEDEPAFHAWIHDFMAGTDLGPDAATEEGQARCP